MPGQDTAQQQLAERTTYYAGLLEMKGLTGAVAYYLTTVRAFAKSAVNTLNRGQDVFGTANSIANLKMQTDLVAMDAAIRSLWTPQELFAPAFASQWEQIEAYATNFNAAISRMLAWQPKADITWAQTQEIADAVQQGNLDAPVITPLLKNDYIRQAYAEGTAFSMSEAAANIRANYSLDDLVATPASNMPLYIGIAVGVVILALAFRS